MKIQEMNKEIKFVKKVEFSIFNILLLSLLIKILNITYEQSYLLDEYRNK